LKLIDVVIPVYNNSQSIPIVASEINSYNDNQRTFRILFVDDGSTDGSWETIEDLVAKPNSNAMGIKLSKNFGQLAAMKAGYQLASGDAVISISADLQDPSELVFKMANQWEAGSALVVCARKNRQDKLFIRMTSAIAYKILGMEVPGIPGGGFDTFLMDKRVYEQLNQLKGRFNFLQADVLSFGFAPKVIEYVRISRPYGRSGYNFRKRFRNFAHGLIDSSYIFIRWTTRLGFAVTFLGLALASFLIIAKIEGDAPFDGFTLIACSVLIIGGVQISLTGVLGSYIWRIYDAIRDRPSSVIEKISGRTHS
jgi:glycosyltransferase involved in cell wall biosynthesis